ncbi:hypothetical protein D3C78_1462740 [compost metagenome]
MRHWPLGAETGFGSGVDTDLCRNRRGIDVVYHRAGAGSPAVVDSAGSGIWRGEHPDGGMRPGAERLLLFPRPELAGRLADWLDVGTFLHRNCHAGDE